MYQKPTLVIISLTKADVITTSNGVDTNGVSIIQDGNWGTFGS